MRPRLYRGIKIFCLKASSRRGICLEDYITEAAYDFLFTFSINHGSVSLGFRDMDDASFMPRERSEYFLV